MPQLLPQQHHRHHHDIRRVQDPMDSEDQDADGEDVPPTHPTTTQQSYHHVPTFNLLIVGRPRTGKTSLARLLLDTSTLAPTISPSRINHLADYANASIRPTSAITCATAELCATPKRSPVTLNIFDTPGIDFQDQAAFEASITLIHRHISDTYRASEDLPVRFPYSCTISCAHHLPSEAFLTPFLFFALAGARAGRPPSASVRGSTPYDLAIFRPTGELTTYTDVSMS